MSSSWMLLLRELSEASPSVRPPGEGGSVTALTGKERSSVRSDGS
jgi:hypothetical protein